MDETYFNGTANTKLIVSTDNRCTPALLPHHLESNMFMNSISRTNNQNLCSWTSKGLTLPNKV